MEPKTLFISLPNSTNINDSTSNNTNIDESTNDYKGTTITEESTKAIDKISDTSNTEETDTGFEPRNNFYFPKKKKKEGKINAMIIVFSLLGVVIILGLSIALSRFYKKKNNNNKILNKSNSQVNLKMNK